MSEIGKLFKNKYSFYFIVIFCIVSTFFIHGTARFRYEMWIQGEVNQHVKKQPDLYGEVLQIIEGGKMEINHKTYQNRLVFTDKGKFTFIYEEDQEEVIAVHQDTPSYQWLENELPITPSVGELLYFHKKDVGMPLKLLDMNTVKTTKGEYVVTYTGEYATNLYKEDSIVGENPLKLRLSKRVGKYLKDKTSEIGEIVQVHLIETKEDKQIFYFETEKGMYRLDAYFSDGAELFVGSAPEPNNEE